HPSHPERICWGCDRYCPADQLACGNGSSRTQHPSELLGDDWLDYGDWGLAEAEAAPGTTASSSTSLPQRRSGTVA
ncbi:MAG TPA: DUF3079 domain-containing protein, partial [Rhodocyclaceae bacterium]|nr:DUF3079 domain-containing protein [Rhodocyclaceae bacterium]